MGRALMCPRPGADGNDRQGRARTQNDDTAALRPPLILPVLSKTGPKSPVRVPKPNAPWGRAEQEKRVRRRPSSLRGRHGEDYPAPGRQTEQQPYDPCWPRPFSRRDGETADTAVLGTAALGHGGSSPSRGTTSRAW